VRTVLSVRDAVVRAALSVRDAVVRTTVAIRDAALAAVNAVRLALVNAARAVRDGVLRAIRAVRTLLVRVVRLLLELVQRAWRSVVRAVIALRDGVVRAVAALYAAIVGAIRAARDAVVAAVRAVRDTVFGAARAARAAMVRMARAGRDAAVRGVRAVADAVLVVSTTVVGTVRRAVRATVRTISRTVTSLIDAVVRGLRAVRRRIVAAVEALRSAVRRAVQRLRAAVVGLAVALATAVRTGIARATELVRRGARWVATTIWSALRALARAGLRPFVLTVRGLRLAVAKVRAARPIHRLGQVLVRPIAGLSIGVQNWADSRAVRRTPAAGARQQQPQPQRRHRAQRIEAAAGPAAVDGAGPRPARTGARSSSRRALRLGQRGRAVVRNGAWVAVVAVVALQVLGIGRSTDGTDLLAASTLETTAERVDGVEGAEGVAPVEPPADPDETAASERDGQAAVDGLIQPEVRSAPPLQLRIPAIEVDTTVVTVGLEPDGAMEIPADVRTVGWYDPIAGAGVAPGEAGTAVIAGHVDSRTQGRGAFWLLRDLTPGDLVEVVHVDGTVSQWQIEEVIRYPKTDVPIADIFTFDGPSRLALITCGGEFDRSSGSYLDNYVVTAVPVPSIAGAPRVPIPTLPTTRPGATGGLT
jgi:sortase (surface protein transpeptidase)